MNTGAGFPQTLRGGLLAAAEVVCLGAAACAAAAFMWTLLDPLKNNRPAASGALSRPLVGLRASGSDPFFRGPVGLAGAAPSTSTGDFTLHATRVAGSQSSAIVSATGSPQATYRTGDMIGDARLVDVLHDRIVIERGGQRQTVEFPRTPGGGLPALADQPPAPELGGPELGGLGLSPVSRDGRPSGLEVSAGASVLIAAGFEAGDVILDVDGRGLTAQALEELQARLASGGAAEIRFERDGQTMTKRIGGSAQ
jgi:hypothetical protein